MTTPRLKMMNRRGATTRLTTTTLATKITRRRRNNNNKPTKLLNRGANLQDGTHHLLRHPHPRQETPLSRDPEGDQGNLRRIATQEALRKGPVVTMVTHHNNSHTNRNEK